MSSSRWADSPRPPVHGDSMSGHTRINKPTTHLDLFLHKTQLQLITWILNIVLQSEHKNENLNADPEILRNTDNLGTHTRNWVS